VFKHNYGFKNYALITLAPVYRLLRFAQIST